MVHVKFCGITRQEDADLAAELGASAIGFIFWPGSPRFIDPYRARQIVRRLPPFVLPVGVFVDQPMGHVEQVAGLVRLGAVQLHGRERWDQYRNLRHRVIKAISPGAHDPPDSLGEIPSSVTLLLDAHDPVTIGGTGRTIDWDAVAVVARERPVILSGGLRPENAAAAIARVAPYGVDVASGVEVSPGIKDHQRMRDFMTAVRSHD
jgi:phosphoribosylanthranilate isomerase